MNDLASYDECENCETLPQFGLRSALKHRSRRVCADPR
ncbi:hypothetical protein GLE_5438 [Lysobacter enzymogenes]|uniref:Uncharacterized protein n=1 Tax=Lysobacter enzymogenes TaxID=69 RepID=A0A0S2DPX6_LYSEN|nr:hypothetical protein GLE_5438 [Lysobacter enzymogenes]